MKIQRKKPGVRAFSGLVGSQFSVATSEKIEATVEKSHNPSAVKARARRAANAAKLAEIKAMLRVPLAERVAAEKVQAQQDREKAEQQKAHDKAMKPTLREWDKAREARAEKQLQELHENRDALDRRHFQDTGEKLDHAGYRADRITEAGGVLGGRQVKGQGTAGTNDTHGMDEKHVTYGVMDSDDNTPLLRANSPFGIHVSKSPVNQSKLRAMLGEDGYHEPTAFEVIPDSDRYRCACCGLEDDWLRTMRNHIEDEIENEMIAYKQAQAKAKSVKEALGEMLMAPGQPIAIEKPVRGPHAMMYHNFKV